MGQSTQWYYESGGERHGPVPSPDIQRLAEQGTIQAGTLVWRAGLDSWVPYRDSGLQDVGIPDGGVSGVYAPPAADPAAPARRRADSLPAGRHISLREGYQFGMRSTFAKSWRLMCGDFWVFIGMYLLAYILYNIASQLVIPTFFMWFPIMGGFMYFSLRRLRGHEAGFDGVFDGFRRRFGALSIITLAMVGPGILYVFGISAMIGMAGIVSTGELASSGFFEILRVVVIVGVALIPPVLVMTLIGSLATLVCLDGDLPAGPSLKLAWRAFQKHWIKLTVFMLILSVLSFSGALALGLGVLVTLPWATIAFSYLYEDAFGDGTSGCSEKSA